MDAQVFTEHFALEDTHWWFRSKRTLVLSLLRRYGVLGGPGLDVGCGAGGTLAVLARQGTWVGVDADPDALALSRRRGLARLAGSGAEALPFRRARSRRVSASICCTTGTSSRRAACSGNVTGFCGRAACCS